jgi:hypothetical protein
LCFSPAALKIRLAARFFDRASSISTPIQFGENLLFHTKRVEEEKLAIARHVLEPSAQCVGPFVKCRPNWFSFSGVMDNLAGFSDGHPDMKLSPVI